jgi:hypothetical protein
VLGSVHLPDPLYLISGQVVVPNTHDLTAAGMEQTVLRATAAGAKVTFNDRGGFSGNFTLDCDAVATNGLVLQCTERELENIRTYDSLGDLIQVGTLTATAQNNKLRNVKGHNAGGNVWVFDGGAANNDMFGCYGEHAGEWLIKSRRSGASPVNGGTQPFNNRFFGGIFERPETVAPLAVADGDGVVSCTAGSDSPVFFGTNLSGVNATTADMPLIEVGIADAGANTARVQAVGACQLDGNAGTSTGVKVYTNGEFRAGGSHLRNCLYGLDFDDTATIYREDLRWGTGITNRYRQRGSQKAHLRVMDLIDASRKADWPTNAISVTSERDGRGWQQSAALTSGTLYVIKAKFPLPAGVPVTEIHFVSGGTALVGGTNQWACLLDSSFNVLAVSDDALATAWGVDTDKAFTIAGSGYVPASDITPYIGLLIAAGTVPNLMGVSHGRAAVHRLPPARIYLGSGASAGLTTPASLPNPVTGLGINSNIEAFAYVK